MRTLAAFFAVALLAGCAPKTETPAETSGPSTQASAPASASGPAPMASGAAGGLTPMSGTENVQGSGMGAMGGVAKGMANRAAAQAGGAGSMGNGEAGGE